jgi:hypothetical protein
VHRPSTLNSSRRQRAGSLPVVPRSKICAHSSTKHSAMRLQLSAASVMLQLHYALLKSTLLQRGLEPRYVHSRHSLVIDPADPTKQNAKQRWRSGWTLYCDLLALLNTHGSHSKSQFDLEYNGVLLRIRCLLLLEQGSVAGRSVTVPVCGNRRHRSKLRQRSMPSSSAFSASQPT